MAPRDLTRLRNLVERRMVDTCAVTTDRSGTDDDTLDEETGLLVQPPGDTPTIYQGPCLIYAATGADNRSADEGERALTSREYLVRIPVTAPEIFIGNLVRVMSSSRDPLLVDQVLRVSGIEHSTNLVSRNLRAELRLAPRP